MQHNSAATEYGFDDYHLEVAIYEWLEQHPNGGVFTYGVYKFQITKKP
jgi:hypothetical protein